MIRVDNPDVIYKTGEEKFQAALEDIKDCHHRGQPVLVGTTSIEKSEYLSRMLKREGIKHEVLNAKHHEKRRRSWPRPGTWQCDHRHQHGRPRHRHRPGRRCGGNGRPAHPGHRTPRIRRIDNQLRGRSGRQGDPGSSRFYLSLEDDLLRIFGSDRIKGLMGAWGWARASPSSTAW